MDIFEVCFKVLVVLGQLPLASKVFISKEVVV